VAPTTAMILVSGMEVAFWVGRDGEDMTFRLERQLKPRNISMRASSASRSRRNVGSCGARPLA